MVARLVFWLFKWAIILSVCIFLIHFWLMNKKYIFSEQSVAAIAKKHLVTNGKATLMYKKIHEEFRQKYPGHILPKEDLQWIFVNAGGWMGSMCLLHASLTEYVLFFGAGLNTEGHSGRYWANISDTVLTGSFRVWKEGGLKVETFKPGDTVHHAVGEATSVNFDTGTWMVEYGRGFIPSTLGFALADTLFSTQDFLTMYYTFRIYIKANLMEANLYVAQFVEYAKSQLT